MNSKSLPLFRGELALCIAVLMNSFGVVLMLYSGAGISAISSVPFAFSEVWPVLTLGTWTYLFQGCLVLSLMLLRKKFVPSYLFSFVEALYSASCWMCMRPGSTSCPTTFPCGWCILW